MLFHSFDYLFFLIAVTIAYYTIPKKFRWVLLLMSSYAFYISWNPFFVLLLIGMTCVAYMTGLILKKKKVNRARVLGVSVFLQLMPLFFYKYLNFFSKSVNEVFRLADVPLSLPGHDFILPLGVSFFTFQTISYCVDVYRGYVQPERHVGYMALYVSFFPQLLAGPIERAKKLIPQFTHNRDFDVQSFKEGCQLILWGLFKKLVIAERLNLYVSEVFDNPDRYQGLTVWIACVFFMFQIYTDFSAYSDIARGSARWLGIELSLNFGNRVYFKPSITAFWREWHITMTSWFRDYVFFPLSKVGNTKRLLFVNLVIVYTLIGFWHGATWGFLIWGATNGIWVAYEQLTKKQRLTAYQRLGLARFPRVLHVVNVLIVLILGSVLGLWFRAGSLNVGWQVFESLFSFDLSCDIEFVNLKLLFALLVFMDLVNYRLRSGEIFNWLERLPRYVRWIFYILVIEMIIHLGIFGADEFYYFRF